MEYEYIPGVVQGLVELVQKARRPPAVPSFPDRNPEDLLDPQALVDLSEEMATILESFPDMFDPDAFNAGATRENQILVPNPMRPANRWGATFLHPLSTWERETDKKARFNIGHDQSSRILRLLARKPKANIPSDMTFI